MHTFTTHQPWVVARQRSAFTLIELLVVIVVLAILMAIAIPTLLNQRKKAWDTDTRSNVSNTYKAMKAAYTDGQTYTLASITEAQESEPQLSITTTGDDYPTGAVKLTVPNDQTTVLTSKSKSGRHFCTVVIETGPGAGTERWEEKGARPINCPAPSVPAPEAPADALVITSFPTVVAGTYPGTYSSTWSGTGATPMRAIAFVPGMGMGFSDAAVTAASVNPDGTWSITVSYTCQSSSSGSYADITNFGKSVAVNAGCGGGSGGTPPPTGGGTPPPPTGDGGGTPPPSLTVNWASYQNQCEEASFASATSRSCTASISGTGGPAPATELTPIEFDAGGTSNHQVLVNTVASDGSWTLSVGYQCPADDENTPTDGVIGGSASLPGSTNSLGLNCPSA